MSKVDGVKLNVVLPELDVKFVKGEKSIGHYKASYMFPKGDSSIFYGLEWDKLKSFVDVMLVAASYVSSFSANFC